MSGFPPTGGFAVHGDGEAQDYEAWANTEFDPQIHAQAWSAGAQPPEPVKYRKHHLWWWGGGLIAVILVLAGVVTNAVIATASQKDELNSWPSGYVNAPSQGPASPTPDTPLPPLPPFVPNMNVAGHQTQDGDYLTRLRLGGITVNDADMEISFAHMMCRNLARGYSVEELALGEYLRYHEGPVSFYAQNIEIGAAVYCPEQVRP